jgi:hypothetical protein
MASEPLGPADPQQIPYDEQLYLDLLFHGLPLLRRGRELVVPATDIPARYNACFRFAAAHGLTLDNRVDTVILTVPD